MKKGEVKEYPPIDGYKLFKLVQHNQRQKRKIKEQEIIIKTLKELL